jgi:hypothetical protein
MQIVFYFINCMQIVFCYKLDIDCILYPVVTGELTSARPSLLQTLVAMVR